MSVTIGGSSYTSTYLAVAYLTVEEFQNAPTGVDWSNLIPGGSPAAQNAELANVILRASAEADGICDQQLASTVVSESVRTRANNRGGFSIATRYWPVRSVLSFSYGASPSTLTALDSLADVWVSEHGFEVSSYGSNSTLYALPLGFGFTPPGYPVFTTYTYVAGWAVTTLAEAAPAGASSVTLASAAGVFGTGATSPTALTFYDGASTETALVTSLAGTVANLAAPLTYAHAAGVSATELPPDVKQAVIALAADIINNYGGEATEIANVGATSPKAAVRKTRARSTAETILNRYRRAV